MDSSVHPYDQVVYLLQGGGALGAYQVGVCEILLRHNFNPDWLVGTSIGSINASLIAGSKPKDRIANMKGFWEAITLPLPETKITENHFVLRKWQDIYSAACTIFLGQNNFFIPRLLIPGALPGCEESPAKISFYDTSVLRGTLEKFIDFDLINQRQTRLTLCAVSVKEGEPVDFDNTKQKIGPEHIMASCALPPGFPAIEIDGNFYWDGGVISNTPLSLILRDKIHKKLLCFMVNLFTHSGELPTSMLEVIKRKKDLSLTSRHHEVLRSLCELHKYQHFIYRLSQMVEAGGPNKAHDKVCQTLTKVAATMGHPTACNIVRFHYHDTPAETLNKDFEFSLQTRKEHIERGRADAMSAMENRDWLDPLPDDAGVAIHDFKHGEKLCENQT